MSNPIIRKVTLGAAYAPLVSGSLVCAVEITVSPSANGAFFLSDDGVTDVPIYGGQRFRLDGVDLSTIQAKGTAGTLTIVGYTRSIG